MTRRPECTCAGTAPGWPQHESFCDTVSRTHADEWDSEDEQ